MIIRWEKEMVFDGTTATFFKTVTTSMHEAAAQRDSQLSCENMKVQFRQRIDFSQPGSSTKPEILQVNCNHNVRLEMYQYDQSGVKLTGRSMGFVAQLEWNRTKGDFLGLGPGDLFDWQYVPGGRRSVVIESRAADSANRPVATDKTEADKLDWEFKHLHFVGEIQGNTEFRSAVVKDRVQVIYAPVPQVHQKFTRKELSQTTPSARGAVWLGCDILRMNLRLIDDDGKNSSNPATKPVVQLTAESSAELEGNAFQATSYQVHFDQEKEKFTLRGRGLEKANLYVELSPETPWSTHTAQTIEFVPSKKGIVADGAKNFSVVPAGSTAPRDKKR